MKKKILALAMSIFTVCSLIGCGKVANDVITVKKYKGLEVSKVELPEITDEDVMMSIYSTMQTVGLAEEKEVTDRAAENEDIVTISYVGKSGDEVFDSNEEYQFAIGANSHIDGFETGIIGHKVGEEFVLDLQFPDPYTNNPDLSGAEAIFTITLKGIKTIVYPELTDEIVPQLSSTATTGEELKEEVREDLQMSNDETAKSQLEQNVWNALIENCVIKEYPEDELEEMLTSVESQYSYVASYYGMEVSALIEAIYGITAEEMAQNLLKQQYAVALIAEKEGLTLTVQDYEDELAEYAAQYGYDDPAEFEEMVGHEELEKMFLQDRVGEWLIENCKQVD